MKSILIVDDDAVFRCIAALALKGEGHQVREAKSGNEATAAIRLSCPDLVLVDGLLPDTDGISWILEQRKGGLRVPVIFVSAFRKTPSEQREVPEGCQISAYLAKPVLPRTLVAEVEAVLEGGAPAAGTT
jgi:DNA-binding response OmpR family regulator